jgi:hypothetical protein
MISLWFLIGSNSDIFCKIYYRRSPPSIGFYKGSNVKILSLKAYKICSSFVLWVEFFPDLPF